ncbi:MAG TPA: flagellar biosynthesis protein FlhA [Candidatus Latescibacteria bacterium]|nr:flagellar biosynthesis protein FlhA [Candidatus Latescibacterota bacterium]
MARGDSSVGRGLRYSEVVVAVGVVGIIFLMIVPLPPLALDVLLTFNITLSLVILLVTMYIVKPLELSVFPGLLLIATLFRLSLNVSSTRLILGEAYAGEVIAAFGSFVVKGNYVLGFIIFLILVVIQFVVITKGAGRIAEVAARFTLDAMPGKQMSIDADLSAGLITDDEARKRREDIAREADFYGAMDGASKFVRGDAIAGIIITIINIIGGLAIGTLQMKISLSQALHTYTLLTVGDGLVTQIPALLLSTSSGILVSRAASESSLGEDLSGQLMRRPKAITVAAGLLLVFALVPGLPTLPFLVLALLAGTLAYNKGRQDRRRLEEVAQEVSRVRPQERVEDYLRMDVLEIEIGYGLIPLVDPQQGGDLLDRVTAIRKQCALELGLIVPPIRIRDNLQLKPNEYKIKIRGVEVGGGELMPNNYLAMNPGYARGEIEGTETTEPAFGLPAKWIPEPTKEQAELYGYTVVEAQAVLATHLTEVIKSHAHEILGRQDVQNLLDNVKQSYPAVVEELVPQVASLGTVQKVLQNLLKERIPIRDILTILETLADYAPMTKDVDVLTEHVRYALRRTICHLYQNEDGCLSVITVDPKVEQLIADSTHHTPLGTTVAVTPDVAQKIFKEIETLIEPITSAGGHPVLLTNPNVRLAFRRLIEGVFPNVVVLSYNEVIPGVEIYSVGVVKIGDED